jgi:hypothetical protein
VVSAWNLHRLVGCDFSGVFGDLTMFRRSGFSRWPCINGCTRDGKEEKNHG